MMTALQQPTIDIAKFVIGHWQAQNSDAGEDLLEPQARLLFGGTYQFNAHQHVEVHKVYRTRDAGSVEEHEECYWQYHLGNRLIVAFPSGYQEIFRFHENGQLERVIALRRVWERKLILFKRSD